jgi:predicted protein tyrosine phosphatase
MSLWSPWWDASCVVPGLYLGGATAAVGSHAREQLLKNNIVAIVNATSSASGVANEFADVCTYHNVDVEDTPETNLSTVLRGAIDFIHEHLDEKQRGAVLVHCMVGSSRSATIVIAYLMCHRRMSLLEAFSLVISRRSVVDPNDGFRCQLMDLEKKEKQVAVNSVDLLQSTFLPNYRWLFHVWIGARARSWLYWNRWTWPAGDGETPRELTTVVSAAQ